MSWSRPGKTAAAGGVVALVAFAAAGGPPAALRFTNPPVQAQAGFCSPALTVELADDAGATAVAPAATVVDLSGGVAFRQGPLPCDILDITQVGIDAGTSAVSFAAYSTAAGRYTVTASSAGLASAAQDVEVLAGPPSRAVFSTGPFTADAGACSPEVVVRLQDFYGNPSPATVPLSLSISTSPSATAKAYSDPACATEIQALGISPPALQGSFYVKDPSAGTFGLGLSGGSVSGSQQNETIRPLSLILQLELAGEAFAAGSPAELRATVRYPGPGKAEHVQLRLSVEGASRQRPTDGLMQISVTSGSFVQVTEPLIITATAGEEVVARGRTVLAPDSAQIGPEVELHRTVDPMVADLGGGCSCAGAGGGTDLAVALAALALLRGSRRRSLCSR